MSSLQPTHIGHPVDYTYGGVQKTVNFYREGNNADTIEARVTSAAAAAFTVKGSDCTVNSMQISHMVIAVQNKFVNSKLSVEEKHAGSRVSLVFHYQ